MPSAPTYGLYTRMFPVGPGINFRIDTLASLCGALGVSSDYIIGRQDEKYKNKISCLLANFSHDEVEHLSTVLESYRTLLTKLGKESDND